MKRYGIEEVLAPDSGIQTCFIIGCDPGPTHTALAVLRFMKDPHPIPLALTGAWYTPNEALEADPESWPVFDGRLRSDDTEEGWPTFLALEKCGAQGKFCGESVFETAAVGGEIRRALRPYVSGIYTMVSADWRHALTGQRNAGTPMIYHEICHQFEPTGGGSDPYKGLRANPGPLWKLADAGKDSGPHVKDAIGAAIGLTMVRSRKGKDPEAYRHR